MKSEWGGKEIAPLQVHYTIFVPYGVEVLVAVGTLGTALGIILGSIGFFVNLNRNIKEI
jgi:hypothetical protein